VIDSDRAMLVWEHKRVVPSHAVLVEAIVGVGVIVSAIVVALGAPIADPIIGLVITALILHITWHIWNAVRGHHH
jgi:divalent metal cation (Fe/Co/Zn/Cd) transporter